jgi:hypothetical protein
MKFSGAFLTFLATLLEVKSFQGPQNLFRTSARQDRTGLDMAVMSPRQGIPAQVVEERDACGVGFIASLDQKSSHETLKHALDACNCMEHRGGTQKSFSLFWPHNVHVYRVDRFQFFYAAYSHCFSPSLTLSYKRRQCER